MNVQKLLGAVAKQLSVGRAFGAAYEKNGTLVIPVALVAGGGGGGEGMSTLPTSDSTYDGETANESDSVTAELPNGSGGGFGGAVVPVGVYVVNDERVRWVPAINANLVIVVTFLTLRLIVRARRHSHR